MSEAINSQPRKLSFLEMTIAVSGTIVTAGFLVIYCQVQTKLGVALGLTASFVIGVIVWKMTRQFLRR
jgi:hypothetical protein